MKQRENNGLTMVDLFCGAGIGAVGFKLAGYNIIDAIDNKQYAVDTYNLNIGKHARLADVRKLDKSNLPYADVFVGGFPCSPFSVAGSQKGFQDKEHGDLGYHFYRLVEEIQPKAFIAENVKGLTFKKHKDFFESLLHNLEYAGYNVTWKLINCFDYGVPQDRERVFIVGIRKDLNKTFEFPEPVHKSERKYLIDAIGDLPNPDSEHDVKNHKEYYKGGFSSRYLSRNRQRQWNEPSYTIVSSARQLPLHPEPPNYDIRKMDEYDCDPPRRFTVRECLRIQTVPDWFYFDDSIDFNKQHERCSGIPSLFAYKLGIQLEKYTNN